MKLTSIILILLVFMSSCAQTKVCHGVQYEPYGLFTKDQKKENVEYRKKVSNVLLGIIFIETIIVPIMVWGFNLWEPVECNEKKNE